MENEDHNYSNSHQPLVVLPDIAADRGLQRNVDRNIDANQEGDVSAEEEDAPEVIVVNDYMDIDREVSHNHDSRETEEALCEVGNKSGGVRRPADDTDDVDSGSLCTICFSTYDTGIHKLCCLKCGHLFGRSCIEHWLKTGCTSTNRKCPTCNTKATLKDIRVLYAKTLVATDTYEVNRLTKKIEQLVNEKSTLESALKNCQKQANLKVDMLTDQIAKHEQTIKKLLSRLGPEGLWSGQNTLGFSSHFISTTKLSENGGCRVLAHSTHLSLLVATQTSTNPALFPGFGIRKINTHDMRPVTYLKLHDACIRDISFCPYERSNLLSVSLDSTAKLFDVQSNVTVQTFKVTEPLWSCCWGPVDAYKIFCGSQNGSFYIFDRRQARGGEPEHVVKVPSQFTGFISLCAVPPRPGRFMPSGGILACSLTSIVAFYPNGGTYDFKVLPIDGNFLSMRYNELTDNVLISAKSSQTWKSPRHLVCQLSNQIENRNGDIDILQTYYATRSPSVLSRSAFIPTPSGDQLICAYNDRDRTLDTWSMSNDKKLNIYDINLPDPVLDLCSFHNADDEVTVPCLSNKNLSVVKFKFKSAE